MVRRQETDKNRAPAAQPYLPSEKHPQAADADPAPGESGSLSTDLQLGQALPREPVVNRSSKGRGLCSKLTAEQVAGRD